MQEDRRSISGIGTRTVERKAGLADELAAAFAHHQAGRLDRAAGLYRKILHKAPDDPAALHLLGVIALSEGRPERAIPLSGTAVAVSPGFAEAHASSMARDLDGASVFMAASSFDLTYQMDRWPTIRFREIKDYQAVNARAA